MDISGRSVLNREISNENDGFYWVVNERLPEGVYTIVLSNAKGLQTQTVTVIR